MKCIRIGTRGSPLALAQAALLRDFLRKSGISVEIVPIKTEGDRILDRTLAEIGGKGLFVRALDRALLDGRVDVAVHSCKDLPMELPAALPILGFSRREDPRDALVLPAGAADWDRTRPVGTCSRRRQMQLAARLPALTVAPVRGSVQTRLEKLDAGQFGALILAAAGLRRLGLASRVWRYFSVDEMVPAAGQGILCVQGRAGEDYGALAGFFDRDAGRAARAERAFAAAVGGGCTSPAAAYACMEGGALRLRGLCECGGALRGGALTGDPAAPEALGARLAARLLEAER